MALIFLKSTKNGYKEVNFKLSLKEDDFSIWKSYWNSTKHKNQFQMIFKSKYKKGENKSSKKIWERPHDLGAGKDSLNNTKSTTIKRKMMN